MRKKLLLAVLAALLPLVSSAQGPSQAQGFVLWAWDLTETSYTYCVMGGQGGHPFATPLVNYAAIKTTGSSTSVTEAVAGTNPFTYLAVGDMLLVRRDPNYFDRVVIVTRTDAANVVVSSAVDWSAGYPFSWLDRTCGTAATNGWFPVGTFTTITAQTEWVTKNATSLEMQTECAMGEGSPVISETYSFTAAGNHAHTITAGVYDRCRVGLKLTTDAGVQLVNAHLSVKW